MNSTIFSRVRKRTNKYDSLARIESNSEIVGNEYETKTHYSVKQIYLLLHSHLNTH